MSSKASKLVDQATSALEEFSEGSFGKLISEVEETKGVVEVRFESTAKGYTGWQWVVTLTQPDKRKSATVAEITCLQVPMLSSPRSGCRGLKGSRSSGASSGKRAEQRPMPRQTH